MSHACLMNVPFVTVIAIAFAYAGVNVFDMDLCGVTSILGISRTSINNRLVTQMRLASPQDRNISVLLEKIRVSGTMMQLPKIGSREKAGGDV
jgi:cytochrome c oxidase assembly protein Cox11